MIGYSPWSVVRSHWPIPRSYLDLKFLGLSLPEIKKKEFPFEKNWFHLIMTIGQWSMVIKNSPFHNLLGIPYFCPELFSISYHWRKLLRCLNINTSPVYYLKSSVFVFLGFWIPRRTKNGRLENPKMRKTEIVSLASMNNKLKVIKKTRFCVFNFLISIRKFYNRVFLSAFIVSQVKMRKNGFKWIK